MAYCLKRNESVSKGVKRIVRRQADNALDELTERHAGRDSTIHSARKCFKKVRAVLRLARDGLGNKRYRRENACFRDAARPLTEVRDTKVLIESFDKLMNHFADAISTKASANVREGLQANRRAVRKWVLNERKTIATVIEAIEKSRGRIRDWDFRRKGWSAICAGLKGIYKQGYRACAKAGGDSTVEQLHEWRKQAKYLWHELQILEPTRPEILDELSEQVHKLTDLLGSDHDLAVLRATVSAKPAAFGDDTSLRALHTLIDRRRGELQHEAFVLGRCIYRDKPKEFTNRLKQYWKVWCAKTVDLQLNPQSRSIG